MFVSSDDDRGIDRLSVGQFVAPNGATRRIRRREPEAKHPGDHEPEKFPVEWQDFHGVGG